MPQATTPFQTQRHAGNNYPFTDASTLLSSDGASTIPSGSFLDARICYPQASSIQYISSIVWDGQNLTINVSGDTSITGSGILNNSLENPVVYLFDSYSRPSGILYVDPELLSSFMKIQKTTIFHKTATAFLPSCVIPQAPSGVGGFLLPDGSVVSGGVWLVGENGVVVTYSAGTVSLNLVGDQFSVQRSCDQQGAGVTLVAPNPLNTINHIGPSADGSFVITAGSTVTNDNILRIIPNGDTLSITLAGA